MGPGALGEGLLRTTGQVNRDHLRAHAWRGERYTRAGGVVCLHLVENNVLSVGRLGEPANTSAGVLENFDVTGERVVRLAAMQ